jgi:hypothetical protein
LKLETRNFSKQAFSLLKKTHRQDAYATGVLIGEEEMVGSAHPTFLKLI